jgi:excisionase family DNA binding protein
MDELLTSQELAKYLKLNQATVIRKAQKGEIPAIRIGKQLRFNKSSIDSWLLRKTVGRPLQILVVDDEQLILNLFVNILKGKDFEVTTTPNPMEASELITTMHFDLIFLDLVMPGMDGSELFRRIRGIDKLVPIVVITGYPDGDLLNKVMEQGPFMVLKKPFSVDEIIKTVRSFA